MALSDSALSLLGKNRATESLACFARVLIATMHATTTTHGDRRRSSLL